MEYSDYIRLKNNMAVRIEDTKIERLESHLYYVS